MRGRIVWFTGLPASGKTTLARRVQQHLRRFTSCVLLDSDELREVLGIHGYAAADRDSFYVVLGRLALSLAAQGQVVLVAATAAHRAYRDAVRTAMPGFIEVHVTATVDECALRDPKGLYRGARAGDAPTLPGVGAPYEPPVAPEVVARGGFDDDAMTAVVRQLERDTDVRSGAGG
jgi:adenylylsulfate kinase